MIDLHTHSLLSDGALLPSELARRYQVLGYKAVAITDHVDSSNIEDVIPRVISVCKELSSAWEIKAIPGVELTHVPLEHIEDMVKRSRSLGLKLVLAHGETIAEPVLPGTNKKALQSGIDILTHPGLITSEEARLAAQHGVYLEITARLCHSLTNGHVARVAREAGAKLILNSDSHEPEDLLPPDQLQRIARGCGLSEPEVQVILKNSEKLLSKLE